MITRKTGEPLFNDRVQSRSSATTSLQASYKPMPPGGSRSRDGGRDGCFPHSGMRTWRASGIVEESMFSVWTLGATTWYLEDWTYFLHRAA